MSEKMNAGYVIKDKISIAGDTYVLGYNPNPGTPAPYVTWSTDNKDYYCFGHYFTDEISARKDLFKRGLECLSEEVVNEIILSSMSDKVKESIIEEDRQSKCLDTIDSCLRTALWRMGLEDSVADMLMSEPDFTVRATHVYYNVDHSAENDALSDLLQNVIEDHFPHLITKGKSSLDDMVKGAMERRQSGTMDPIGRESELIL